MLHCPNCKHVFHEDEIHTYKEHQGECHGAEAYETWYVCPRCLETGYVEAGECASCGEWLPVSEMEDGLCCDCWTYAEYLLCQTAM